MDRKEFQKLLRRYRKGLCTPQEEALVEVWFKSMESAEVDPLNPSEKAKIKETTWSKVYDYITDSKEERLTRRIMLPTMESGYRTISAIAATVLLLILSFVFLTTGFKKHGEQHAELHVIKRNIFNNTDKIMKVYLPDSSVVLLQPKSTIAFSNPFRNSQRIVVLEGEAFFSISRDTLRPFLVNTNEVVTKVLGTSFNVSAFLNDDNVTVAVKTGKVSVLTRKDKHAVEPYQETILTPNQKITYSKSKKIMSRAIIDEPLPIVSAEVVKRMHFEAAPVKKIFEALEQVYGIDIEFDEHRFSCSLTTSIAGGSIYNRLDMICKAINAQYVVHEDRIVITGSGCTHSTNLP